MDHSSEAYLWLRRHAPQEAPGFRRKARKRNRAVHKLGVIAAPGAAARTACPLSWTCPSSPAQMASRGSPPPRSPCLIVAAAAALTVSACQKAEEKAEGASHEAAPAAGAADPAAANTSIDQAAADAKAAADAAAAAQLAPAAAGGTAPAPEAAAPAAPAPAAAARPAPAMAAEEGAGVACASGGRITPLGIAARTTADRAALFPMRRTRPFMNNPVKSHAAAIKL